MFLVYVGLGSNLGDRLQFLTNALEEIRHNVRIRSLSSVYETEPVGMESSSMFYNIAACIETDIFPVELLGEMKKVEKKLGRKTTRSVGDREIDIDLLLYRGWAYQDRNVTVPHPKLESRRFVLEPMNEIAPTAIHPVSGKTIGTLLRQCRDHNKVERTLQLLNLTI